MRRTGAQAASAPPGGEAMARIVLASGSPRRQELLTRIGIRDFTVRVPQVEEWYPQGLTPPEIVSYISREKSQAVPSEEDEIVITADTMVFLDQQRLGKPKDEADALRMLTDLAGRRHTVCTGVTLRQGQRSLTRAQSTDVYFRPAGREELMAYIRGGEPMDKAGAYGIQGRGALFVIENGIGVMVGCLLHYGQTLGCMKTSIYKFTIFTHMKLLKIWMHCSPHLKYFSVYLPLNSTHVRACQSALF